MAPTRASAATRKLVAALCLVTTTSCSDFGTSPDDGLQTGGEETAGAEIRELVPARTIQGDSVRVVGSGFGAAPAGATLRFTGSNPSGAPLAHVFAWTDEELIVQVPVGAVTGPVRFERDAEVVSGPVFDVAPRRVTYSGDLVPALEAFGCASCHGGSGNLDVRPWAALMMGDSDHGPVVVPRRSKSSLLVERLRPETPSALRMPQGGPYLDAGNILLFADWIDQGAQND